MSRRVYLLGLGLSLVALAFALTDALLWRPGATEANVRRIRPGMTLREAEAILGGPADWDHDIKRFDPTIREEYRPEERWIKGWNGQQGSAAVYLDEADRVTRAWWDENPDAELPPSPLARLRAWLGW
jgi:hypothetical protein